MSNFTALLLLAAASRVLSAQETASISGVISDSSGAVVKGAEVTIINSESHAKRETSTNKSGSYSFLQLPAGMYELSAGKMGFQKILHKGVGLTVNQAAFIPLALSVGAISSSIVVTEDAPIVAPVLDRRGDS